MADVFISYKRDERAAVERIAEGLRELGLAVWFDASLSAGDAFSDEIDREARAARCILVCWSPSARESKWVKAEAEVGFGRDTLVAAHVAGPDGFEAPVPFNRIHTEDLRAWHTAPRHDHSGWRSLLRSVGRLCGRADIESFGALDAQASAAQLSSWISQHENSPLFVAVESMLQARKALEVERAEVERAARERRAREEAERRAQDEVERRAQQEKQRQLEEERARVAQAAASEETTRKIQASGMAMLDQWTRDVEHKRAAAAKRSQQLRWALIAAVAIAGVYFLMTSAGPIRDALFAEPAEEEAVLSSDTTACASQQQQQACDLLKDTLASAEQVWAEPFRLDRLPRYGGGSRPYQNPTLVVFSESTDTACGAVTSAVGPFYCPSDQRLYVDPSFDEAIARRYNPPGQFFQAYIIAHEVAHHVQNFIGATSYRLPGETDNQTSVRVELQADCLEGVWGNSAWPNLAIDDANLRDLLFAPHGGSEGGALTQGTSAQRMRWFRRGFDSGDARQCDTFGVPAGQL